MPTKWTAPFVEFKPTTDDALVVVAIMAQTTEDAPAVENTSDTNINSCTRVRRTRLNHSPWLDRRFEHE